MDFYGNSRWNAQALCNTLFDPKVSDPVAGRAWLGKDVPGEWKCCGDDPAEYYAGPTDEGKDSGCWNSQPIQDKETVMNVEAED